MNQQQYDNWKDFSLRMARSCFNTRRRPSREWVIGMVEGFFKSMCPENIECIVDWDNSRNYPEGNPYYRKTYRCVCWDCQGKGCDKHWCEDGHVYNYASPYCVGDSVSLHLDDECGYGPQCNACRDHLEADCRCDEIQERFDEQWDEQWGGPVRCCIRAGLDLASAPSAGVLGFTVCDLRKMYPEGIPDWINTGFVDRNDSPVDLNSGDCDVSIWL